MKRVRAITTSDAIVAKVDTLDFVYTAAGAVLGESLNPALLCSLADVKQFCLDVMIPPVINFLGVGQDEKIVYDRDEVDAAYVVVFPDGEHVPAAIILGLRKSGPGHWEVTGHEVKWISDQGLNYKVDDGSGPVSEKVDFAKVDAAAVKAAGAAAYSPGEVAILEAVADLRVKLAGDFATAAAKIKASVF